jgi:hypothetical protein
MRDNLTARDQISLGSKGLALGEPDVAQARILRN